MQWFELKDVRDKIQALPEALGTALNLTESVRAFKLGRDVDVVPITQLPPKAGLATDEGQARLLHDLANIELQAMELAVRTLCEFHDAHPDFRKELAAIAESEARHLDLCIKGVEALGYHWGHWKAHLSLWNTVGPEDTLLDRILIVHRYLEGSGLDAGDSILRRLSGVPSKQTREAVKVIVDEEVDHVLFGTKWYRKTAESLKIDPEEDFEKRIALIARRAPRRERLARELRLRAGFTDRELSALDACLSPLEAAQTRVRSSS